MPQAAAITESTPTGRYPLEEFLADISGISTTTDLIDRRRRSRDYFWYSPILYEQLKDMLADIVVTPRDEAEVVRVAAACARHRIPLTVRGGATGNYGQCVPLQGGVVLDMAMLNRIEWQKPGLVRVEAGAKLFDIDAVTRPNGFELRMHPSTKRTAEIGGFVAGGSGGVGSVAFGGMREPGNIVAARIVTLEDNPRVIELRGDAAQKISRAYGTTGIITVLEMPLAPAQAWIDVIVAFDEFIEAVRFGHAIAMADGIVKKLLSPIQWPVPQHFAAFRPYCPEGKSLLLGMIGEMSIEGFETLLAPFRGTITYKAPSEDVLGKVPLYEHAWNHTTLQMLKSDRGVTYLQCLYPHDRLVDAVAQIGARFDDEVLQHLEFIRLNGLMTASGIPIVRYRSAERLYEIMAAFEACGVMIANPHVVTLEDGSRYKRVDADQLGFKHEVDPMGLLNPGKMRSFVPQAS
ncbi:MAG: FAD-binding oxidoreductase [Xanthobacteraceae bacterium]